MVLNPIKHSYSFFKHYLDLFSDLIQISYTGYFNDNSKVKSAGYLSQNLSLVLCSEKHFKANYVMFVSVRYPTSFEKLLQLFLPTN